MMFIIPIAYFIGHKEPLAIGTDGHRTQIDIPHRPILSEGMEPWLSVLFAVVTKRSSGDDCSKALL
jgi:hypothetical protein